MLTMPSQRSTPQDVHLAFIGGGQMASALARGLVDAGWPRANLTFVEPAEGQRAKLVEALGVQALAEPGHELLRADVVVWAVKPQVLEQAIHGTVGFLDDPLHISIAAGIRTSDIARWATSRRIIRVMPNTAALVGAGISGLYASAEVEAGDRSVVEQILAPTGYCFWVESDEQLNAVTAVSGSGPAYVFHFMEAFQAAAEALGFRGPQARDLVIRTVAGAVEQAQHSDADFSLLRQNVTSKRGTTEAALAILDRCGTPAALAAAVAAAQVRAVELSIELGGAV